MATVDVGGAILWGACSREWGKTLADNPYAAAPGTYTLHNAWEYGFQNAAKVQAEHYGDDPADPAYDDLRNPVPRDLKLAALRRA
jgi:hypothetical protein